MVVGYRGPEVGGAGLDETVDGVVRPVRCGVAWMDCLSRVEDARFLGWFDGLRSGLAGSARQGDVRISMDALADIVYMSGGRISFPEAFLPGSPVPWHGIRIDPDDPSRRLCLEGRSHSGFLGDDHGFLQPLEKVVTCYVSEESKRRRFLEVLGMLGDSAELMFPVCDGSRMRRHYQAGVSEFPLKSGMYCEPSGRDMKRLHGLVEACGGMIYGDGRERLADAALSGLLGNGSPAYVFDRMCATRGGDLVVHYLARETNPVVARVRGERSEGSFPLSDNRTFFNAVVSAFLDPDAALGLDRPKRSAERRVADVRLLLPVDADARVDGVEFMKARGRYGEFVCARVEGPKGPGQFVEVPKEGLYLVREPGKGLPGLYPKDVFENLFSVVPGRGWARKVSDMGVVRDSRPALKR